MKTCFFISSQFSAFHNSLWHEYFARFMMDFLHKLITALFQVAPNLVVYACVLLIWPSGLSPEKHMLTNMHALFGLLVTGWCVSTHLPGERHSPPLMPVINQAQQEGGGGEIFRKGQKKERDRKKIWKVKKLMPIILMWRGMIPVVGSWCSQTELRPLGKSEDWQTQMMPPHLSYWCFKHI